MTGIPAGQCCRALSYRGPMSVQPGSPEPLYLQLATVIRQRIRQGDYDHGPLPSVRALRQEFDLGEFAVVHALRLLAEENLIFSVPRRGYYVRQRP